MNTRNFIYRQVRENGFYIGDIDINLKDVMEEISSLESLYSEAYVKSELFKPKEDHQGRSGYAVLVGNNECECNYVNLENYKNLNYAYTVYKEFLEKYFDLDPEYTNKFPTLLNWQKYLQGSDNSLPWHIDVDIKKGSWEKYSIDIQEGIIPKFVMVIVTENDNDGKGLEIKVFEEDFKKAGIKYPDGGKPINENGKKGKIIKINLSPGQVIIFDNTLLQHGVTESLPNKRTMFGFRSFIIGAKYFTEDPNGNYSVGNYLKGNINLLDETKISEVFGCKNINK